MSDEPIVISGSPSGTAPDTAPPIPPPVPKPPEKKGGIADTFSGLRVSLVPKDLLGQEGPDLKLRLLTMVMVLVLETGLILTGYYLINRSLAAKETEKAKLEQQYQTTRMEASAKEKEMNEAMVFSRQADIAVKTLDRHVYLTELIDFIEGNTLGGIRLDRVLLDTKNGLVSLDVVAPKYRAMAEQFVRFGLQKEIIQMRHTAVAGTISDEGGLKNVNATVILKVNPSVWIGHPAMGNDNQK